MNELKPCPFCGNKLVYLDRYQNSLINRFVRCPKCGARTGRCIDDDTAIERWNMRRRPKQGKTKKARPYKKNLAQENDKEIITHGIN